ncbi:hypothetical protein [Archangium violaceum]
MSGSAFARPARGTAESLAFPTVDVSTLVLLSLERVSGVEVFEVVMNG